MTEKDRDGRKAPPDAPERTRDAVAPAAWRITLEYAGDRISVVAQQRVAMVAPPDDAELLERGRAGYWVEIRDARGRTLYQQVLSRPIRHDYEVFSPEPGVPPQRVAAQELRGVFQVVVPDVKAGHEIVLFGRPTLDELQTRPPRQLVKATLRETPPGGSVR
jgi:hypothetical protein